MEAFLPDQANEMFYACYVVSHRPTNLPYPPSPCSFCHPHISRPSQSRSNAAHDADGVATGLITVPEAEAGAEAGAGEGGGGGGGGGGGVRRGSYSDYISVPFMNSIAQVPF